MADSEVWSEVSCLYMADTCGENLKTYPRSGCFRRRRAIYKRDVSVRKAKSAIHNADRPVEMGILREVISREYTLRPTAEEWRVAWQLIRVLAAARGTSRMVPRWVVLRLVPEPFVPHRRPCRMDAVERWLAQPPWRRCCRQIRLRKYLQARKGRCVEGGRTMELPVSPDGNTMRWVGCPAP